MDKITLKERGYSIESNLMIIFILLIGGLIGCGDNDQHENSSQMTHEDNINEVEEHDSNNKINEDAEHQNNDNIHINQEKIAIQMEKLKFAEFDLDVTYANDVGYEAEIEKKDNGQYIVKLKDEINGVKLTGTDAFDHIYPIINNLSLTKEDNEADVITNILNKFNLDYNYHTFELELIFSDGIKIEYEDRQ